MTKLMPVTLEIHNLYIPFEDTEKADEAIGGILVLLDELAPGKEVNFDFDIVEDDDEEAE